MIVSGGDAPGINACLLRYVALATDRGDSVVGAIGGFAGLLDQQLIPLTTEALLPWAGMAGTYLQTSRKPVLSEVDAPDRLVHTIKKHGIDNLILFGGNGTLKYIPPLLKDWDIRCIGLPTTIDNDVAGTERTLGFDSACNYAYRTVDGIVATAHALHGRIFMVETLGGDSGFLALAIAQGAGAHAVLVPEYTYDNAWLGQRLLAGVARDQYALLVLSEGVKTARTLVEEIPTLTGIRVRDTRLGHAQRGSTPSHQDRVLGASMAQTAYQSLCAGATFGTVVVRNQQVILDENTLETLPTPTPDIDLYNLVNGIKDHGTAVD